MNVKRYFTSAVCAQISQQLNEYKTLTVSVELIPRVDGQNVYNGKVLVQLKEFEVAIFLETLLMYRQEFELGYHGSNKDKLLVIRNQPTGLFIYMREGKAEKELNTVLKEDVRFDLLTLVADTVAKRDGVTIKDVLDLLRTLALRRHQLQNPK